MKANTVTLDLDRYHELIQCEKELNKNTLYFGDIFHRSRLTNPDEIQAELVSRINKLESPEKELGEYSKEHLIKGNKLLSEQVSKLIKENNILHSREKSYFGIIAIVMCLFFALCVYTALG